MVNNGVAIKKANCEANFLHKSFVSSIKSSNFAPQLRNGHGDGRSEDCKRNDCGNSSVGRAQPCQGWGREFESRFPLLQNNGS